MDLIKTIADDEEVPDYDPSSDSDEEVRLVATPSSKKSSQEFDPNFVFLEKASDYNTDVWQDTVALYKQQKPRAIDEKIRMFHEKLKKKKNEDDPEQKEDDVKDLDYSDDDMICGNVSDMLNVKQKRGKKRKRGEDPVPPISTQSDDTPSFQQMNLSRPLLKAITSMKFVNPTPIQSATIPVALLGKDIYACAATGTGKTAAYMLPVLERLLFKPFVTPVTRVLVLVPTRELGVQVFQVSRQLAQFTKIQIGISVGGLDLKQQEASLRSNPDVVIATPGRLIDHIHNTPSFHLESIEILILDEADRILDEYFAEQLKEIIKQCSYTRQTMLFSATMTENVEDLASVSLKNPVKLFVNSNATVAQNLHQEFIKIRSQHEKHREAIVAALLLRTFHDHVIVFVSTKRQAHRLHVLLSILGIKTGELHGNLRQPQRLEMLRKFKEEECDVLLATDVAARGLDIEGVRTVLNFALPATYQHYIHRVGRTARAGRAGRSVSLVGEAERKLLKLIVKNANEPVKQRVIAPEVIQKFAEKIETLEPMFKKIVEDEEAEKELAAAEGMAEKATKKLKSPEMAQQQREWFREKGFGPASKSKTDTKVKNPKHLKTKKQKKGETKEDIELRKLADYQTRIAKRKWKDQRVRSVPEDPSERHGFTKGLVDTSRKNVKFLRHKKHPAPRMEAFKTQLLGLVARHESLYTMLSEVSKREAEEAEVPCKKLKMETSSEVNAKNAMDLAALQDFTTMKEALQALHQMCKDMHEKKGNANEAFSVCSQLVKLLKEMSKKEAVVTIHLTEHLEKVNILRKAPLPVLWLLDTHGVVYLDQYLNKYVSDKEVIQAFISEMASHVHHEDGFSQAESIVAHVLACLLNNSQGSSSTKVGKLSQIILDSFTRRLLDRQDALPGRVFEKLRHHPCVQMEHLKSFFMHEVRFMVTYKPGTKASVAIKEQEEWNNQNGQNKCNLSQEIFQQILPVFHSSEVVDCLENVLAYQEVNWFTLFSLISAYVKCFQNDGTPLQALIRKLLEEGFSSLNEESLLAAFLLARQATYCTVSHIASYKAWFHSLFGEGQDSLTKTKPKFLFLVKFLSSLVPHESSRHLRAQVGKKPFIPSGCYDQWLLYSTLVRTRLAELNDSSLEKGIYEAQPVASDDREVLARIHMKGRENGEGRRKFITALFEAKKIPDAMYREFLLTANAPMIPSSSMAVGMKGFDLLESSDSLSGEDVASGFTHICKALSSSAASSGPDQSTASSYPPPQSEVVARLLQCYFHCFGKYSSSLSTWFPSFLSIFAGSSQLHSAIYHNFHQKAMTFSPKDDDIATAMAYFLWNIHFQYDSREESAVLSFLDEMGGKFPTATKQDMEVVLMFMKHLRETFDDLGVSTFESVDDYLPHSLLRKENFVKLRFFHDSHSGCHLREHHESYVPTASKISVEDLVELELQVSSKEDWFVNPFARLSFLDEYISVMKRQSPGKDFHAVILECLLHAHMKGLSGCDSLLVLLLWLNRMLNPNDSPGLLKIWEKVSRMYHGTANRASLDQAFLRLYLSLPSWILLQADGDQDTQVQELCAAIKDSWVHWDAVHQDVQRFSQEADVKHLIACMTCAQRCVETTVASTSGAVDPCSMALLLLESQESPPHATLKVTSFLVFFSIGKLCSQSGIIQWITSDELGQQIPPQVDKIIHLVQSDPDSSLYLDAGVGHPTFNDSFPSSAAKFAPILSCIVCVEACRMQVSNRPLLAALSNYKTICSAVIGKCHLQVSSHLLRRLSHVISLAPSILLRDIPDSYVRNLDEEVQNMIRVKLS
ncbi:unnamed protein product [Darwinula stevensoni]|uniref:RNA helicase n=1 Tax=Darwinula stevensoni TaxID=69355 RepID=A0A7R8X0B9_9CRUS|nr:unnamed protein product [Darwinula stevensoni]CAG0881066.1 unnamed protein product [Darwinula stevensoni]